MAHSSAIVTFVTSEDFVIGARVMVQSLLVNNCSLAQNNIVLAVLVTSNISSYSRSLLLSSGFNQVIEVNEIPNPNPISSVHVKNWVDVGFTKLRIWSLIQFEKILYIDADCVVVADITHLLTDNKYKAIHFAAAPDIFPPDNFNAGVLLIKPDLNIFNTLIQEMPYIASYDGGDTGFLNHCSPFKHWFESNDDAMLRLNYGYNAQRTMHWFTKQNASYWSSIESRLKIIHYSSSPKPWNIKPSQRMVDRLEVIWHKHWIALNEHMNQNKNKKIALNDMNHILSSDNDTQSQTTKCQFNGKLFTEKSFDELMTKRVIDFGRVYEGSSHKIAIEFERNFLKKCAQRFARFTQQIIDNALKEEQTKCGAFIFDDIPKIIHQIWLGPNPLPEQYKAWSESWIKLHPKWQYMLWTDESLMENKFEWSSLVNKSLFEISKNFGEKSDILRLEILYKFGGVYVDFDFECIQSLDAFDYTSRMDEAKCSVSCVFGLSNTGLLEVNNAWIACRPKHEILTETWKCIQVFCNESDTASNGNEWNAIIRTGPIQITRCLMNCYAKFDDVLLFPTQCFYPLPNNMRYLPISDRFRYYNDATFAVHHWGVSWNAKHKNYITTNESHDPHHANGINSDCQQSTDDSKANVIDSIMTNSDNLALQSRIMSFLQ